MKSYYNKLKTGVIIYLDKTRQHIENHKIYILLQQAVIKSCDKIGQRKQEKYYKKLLFVC